MDRDLEPGNLTVPDISLMGCSTISEGFWVVATDAEILKEEEQDLVVKTESLFKTHKHFTDFFRFLDPKGSEGRNVGTWGL